MESVLRSNFELIGIHGATCACREIKTQLFLHLLKTPCPVKNKFQLCTNISPSVKFYFTLPSSGNHYVTCSLFSQQHFCEVLKPVICLPLAQLTVTPSSSAASSGPKHRSSTVTSRHVAGCCCHSFLHRVRQALRIAAFIFNLFAEVF